VQIIIAVRHGESASNHAFQTAREQGRPVRMPGRDADVPLSDLGVEQAAELGRWWADLPEEQRPTIALCSPYLRARETLRIATERAGVEIDTIVDDRLRDRLKGDFELWNDIAVAQTHPHEAARRQQDGVFHYVPPNGESLWNVGDRVRDLLTDLAPRLAGQRVLIMAHDAVVLMLCRVLEGLDHERMLAINDQGLVANASRSTWRQTDGRWTPDGYGITG
jgi:2,3-bisphosphoglycerate-dependent phosphoglycerate mutase